MLLLCASYRRLRIRSAMFRAVEVEAAGKAHSDGLSGADRENKRI